MLSSKDATDMVKIEAYDGYKLPFSNIPGRNTEGAAFRSAATVSGIGKQNSQESLLLGVNRSVDSVQKALTTAIS